MVNRTKLLLLVLVFGACSMLASVPAQADIAADEAAFVTMINDLRRSKNLPELEVHPDLIQPCREWASHLADIGELQHASDLAAGVSVYWTKLGENVGVAPIDRAEAMFDAFVASPTHYQNLVDPAFSFVGVGVVYDDDGRMWTAHRFMAVGESHATSTTPTSGSTATSSEAPPSTKPQPAPAPSEQPTTSPTTAVAEPSTTTAEATDTTTTEPAPSESPDADTAEETEGRKEPRVAPDVVFIVTVQMLVSAGI